MRKFVVLKGEKREILLMIEKNETCRWNIDGVRTGLKLALFTKDGKVFEVEESFDAPEPEEIIAAALLRNNEIEYFGSVKEEFGKEKALRILQGENASEIERPKESKNERLQQNDEAMQKKTPYIPASLFNMMNESEAPGDCPLKPKLSIMNPFWAAFPDSEWRKVEFPVAGWHYLTGEIYKNGALCYRATAVPGSYSVKAPANLPGSARFITGELGAYWIWLEKA